MKRITPALAGLSAALIVAPLTALAATSAGIVDQAMAWIITAIATAATSAIAAVIARLVGAQLDARARATIQTAMERASALALTWVLDQAADTPIGKRISAAARQMLPYVDEGAADSLRRFGLERDQLGSRQHLQDMAEAELVKQIAKVAPDHLTQALIRAGAPGGR
ncbi:hypothetical protein [Paracoccus sp. (in: a-proteobacteria)]|uniref:hypothetical protein n=1 Tax=Paracoccus sp. TaxID=267 RepID=UPI002729F8D5|nr:hypothetical protein [Paracoccus sp. (in: a-proteobacteria)]